MRTPVCILGPRPNRLKKPRPRRRLEPPQQRERVLRERVAYMLWVMANRID